MTTLKIIMLKRFIKRIYAKDANDIGVCEMSENKLKKLRAPFSFHGWVTIETTVEWDEEE